MDARAKDRDLPSLLFPELWTTEYLISVLEKRYVSRPDLHSLEREELLNIYYDLILPKPQRTHRPNRRGRIMTAAQNLANKRKRITSPESQEGSQSYTIGGGGRGPPVSSAKRPQYRLKPPPSVINPECKVIRLSNSPSSSTPKADSAVDGEKAKTPVTSPTTLTPARTQGKIKLKRPSSSDSSVTSPVEASPVASPTSLAPARTSGVIKLNRSASSNSAIKSPDAVSTEKSSTAASASSRQTKTGGGKDSAETPAKKPKISKISWP